MPATIPRVDDGLKTLEACGMPTGAPRRVPVGPVPVDRLRSALVRVLEALERDPDLAVPLLAWLQAFRQHWPSRFAEVLGADGEGAIDRLTPLVTDENHYLKLRRIAIENLSARL